MPVRDDLRLTETVAISATAPTVGRRATRVAADIGIPQRVPAFLNRVTETGGLLNFMDPLFEGIAHSLGHFPLSILPSAGDESGQEPARLSATAKSARAVCRARHAVFVQKIQPIGGKIISWRRCRQFRERSFAPIFNRIECHAADHSCGNLITGGVGMIRSELIQKIADENPHLYQRDVERIVNTIFEEIINAMSDGNRVELRGFGAFSIKKRDARVGRNPRTGDAVEVDEKHVPFFKTGKMLRDRLNGKE